MGLTARQEDQRAQTQKSLDQHFPDIQRLQMVNSYEKHRAP